MKTIEAIKRFSEWDRQGRYIYTKRDLHKLLDSPSENTLNQMLKRLVAKGVLVRAAQGIYVYAQSSHIGTTALEAIALALRPGEYMFESMESALSQWGAISQIPLDRLTLVTTGKKGEYKTPYGVIEFTHTASAPQEIIENTIQRPDHLVPLATQEYALRNLKNSRRNLTMLRESD